MLPPYLQLTFGEQKRGLAKWPARNLTSETRRSLATKPKTQGKTMHSQNLPWTEQIYGIPPEQVIGSSIKTKFEMREGKPVLMRLPQLNFNDDKADKPVGINQHIGGRPIAAFGNSRGDKEMLEYTQGGSGERLELLVLHDDATREYAYGPALGLPDPKLGAFTQSLYDQAKQYGWTVVSMKNN